MYTKKLLIMLFCNLLAFLIVIASWLYAAVPENEQVELWVDLRNAKNKLDANTLDTWSVIEGIRLIRKIDHVSKEAAALAMVIKHDKGDKLIYGDDDVSEELAKKAKKKNMSKRDTAKMRERFNKQNAMISEEYESVKKGRDKFITRGADFSLLIEKYLTENQGNLEKAMNAFAAKRAYNADVVMKKNPSFMYIAKSIKKGKPVILRQTRTDKIVVCIGFLTKGTAPYVITANPAKIEFEEMSNADLILGEGAMAQRARKKAKDLDKQFGLAKQDRKFNIEGTLPQGIEINTWVQENYISYTIDFVVTEQSVDKAFPSVTGGLVK